MRYMSWFLGKINFTSLFGPDRTTLRVVHVRPLWGAPFPLGKHIVVVIVMCPAIATV
jgi:hypothetical protein